MSDRTAQLDALMTAHGLTARQVGDLVGRKPHTVRCWRCKNDTSVIPVVVLELLKLKIAARAGGNA